MVQDTGHDLGHDIKNGIVNGIVNKILHGIVNIIAHGIEHDIRYDMMSNLTSNFDVELDVISSHDMTLLGRSHEVIIVVDHGFDHVRGGSNSLYIWDNFPRTGIWCSECP